MRMYEYKFKHIEDWILAEHKKQALRCAQKWIALRYGLYADIKDIDIKHIPMKKRRLKQ